MQILLVDDNLGDVLLMKEAFRSARLQYSVSVARDGVEAMAFLRRHGEYSDAPRPDIILLDLNMPRKNGVEVLSDLKKDEDLRLIPVVVLSSSQAADDVFDAYSHHANCFVSKCVDLDQMVKLVHAIDDLWMTALRAAARYA